VLIRRGPIGGGSKLGNVDLSHNQNGRLPSAYGLHRSKQFKPRPGIYKQKALAGSAQERKGVANMAFRSEPSMREQFPIDASICGSSSSERANGASREVATRVNIDILFNV
jgi:hypothetical protein